MFKTSWLHCDILSQQKILMKERKGMEGKGGKQRKKKGNIFS
jgi:hypothetical protein